MAGLQPTLVRTYKGHQQHDAVAAFREDAKRLATQGYVPTSQSWAPGQWGCGAFLVALVLFLVLIGIVVFIYMVLVKPDGTLTVTYQLQVPAPATVGIPQGPPATLAARLAELDEARRTGLIGDQEYQAKRANVLRDH